MELKMEEGACSIDPNEVRAPLGNRVRLAILPQIEPSKGSGGVDEKQELQFRIVDMGNDCVWGSPWD